MPPEGSTPTGHALAIGVASYSRLGDDGEVVPGGYDNLDFAHDCVNEVAAALRRFGYDVDVTVDPTADVLADLEIRLEDPAPVRVVHVIGHGVEQPRSRKLALLGPGGAGTTTIEHWLETVEDHSAPPTLFLLDLCGAGEVAQLPWQVQHAAAERRAWVLAAAPARKSAYDGNFSRELARVLQLIADGGGLDTARDRRFHSWFAVSRTIRRAVELTGSGSFKQAVTGSLIDSAEDEPNLPFLPNRQYQQPSELQRLKDTLDEQLGDFLDELDTGLDARHFAGRAGGRSPGRLGRFQGRRRQLGELTRWLDESDGGIRVVTGRPGSGKSALLGVLVCAGHPQLREPTRRIWDECDKVPAQQTLFAAVHARQRGTAEIIASLGRQLGLEAPEDGWSPKQIVAAIGNLPTPPTIVLDALDEAIRPADVLRQMIEPLSSKRRIAGPPACRLIVGSRTGDNWAELATLTDGRSADELINLDDDPVAELRDALAKYLRYALSNWLDHSLLRQLGRGVAEALTTPESQANEWGEFVVAGLLIGALSRQAPPRDADECEALIHAVPTTLPAVLDLDLARSDHPVVGRAVLTALAFGLGEGMPRSVLAALAPVLAVDTEVKITESAVAAALDRSRFYLRTSTDDDGTTLYRLFHQGLADHLSRISVSGAHRAIADALVEHVTDSDGHRRWDLAEPYLLRHMFDHAEPVGRVDELLCDTELLVYARPTTVSAYLAEAETEPARLLAAVYRASMARAWALPAMARRQLLAMDAARHGDPALAARLAQGQRPISSAWLPRWATGGSLSAERVATFTGHTDWVTAVATTTLHGDPIAVTTSADGTVRIWNLRTHQPLGDPLTGHTDWVNAVATTTLHGDPIAITTSHDRTVRVWNLRTHQPVGTPLTGHTASVTAVATTTLDGDPIAITTSDDETVRVWNLRTHQSLGTLFTGHTASVRAVATTTLDGDPIAITTSHDRSVRVWNLRTHQPLGTLFTGHTASVTAVATTTLDGDPIAITTSHDHTVRVWNLRTHQPLGTLFTGHNRSVNAVATTTLHGAPIAVTTSWDRTVRVWNLRTHQPLGDPLTGHTDPVTAVATTTLHGAPIAVTTSWNRTVRVWNLRTHQPLGDPLTGHTDPVTAVATTTLHGDPIAVTTSRDETVRVWNLRTHQPHGDPLTGHTAPVTAVATTTLDGEPIAITTSHDETVRVWNLRTHQPHGKPLTGHTHSVTAVATTTLHDDPIAITTSHDETVRVWNLRTHQPHGDPLTGHTHSVTAVATTTLHDDPIAIITTSDDDTVRVWNLRTHQPHGKPLTGHTAPVRAVATTTLDGEPIAVTTGDDATVRVWNLPTRTEIDRFQLPEAGRAVAVHEDLVVVGFGVDIACLQLPDRYRSKL